VEAEIKRLIANIVAGVLATLALLLCCLWLRSYRVMDRLMYAHGSKFEFCGDSTQFSSIHGAIRVLFYSEYIDIADQLRIGGKKELGEFRYDSIVNPRKLKVSVPPTAS